MQILFSSFIKENQQVVNKRLVQLIHQMEIPSQLKESMLYSIEAGGKRLRPILMMAACQSYGETTEQVLDVACALEMIHTYSLIHDDLPAMDDDDYRRGKLTNHKKFDEATAILAGDGLLTVAFKIISTSMNLTDKQKVFLIQELSHASGPEGMVAGQMLDMEAENKQLTLKELERIHHLKTGELLRFALMAGAYIGGANPEQLIAIEDFAKYIGLIFQVQDDILDVVGDEKELGKPVGSDEHNQKSTYPKLLGIDGAIKQKEAYQDLAMQKLKLAGVKGSLLEDFVAFIGNRTH